MALFANLQECLDYIEFQQSRGRAIPQNVLDEKAQLEAEESINDDEFIFSTMAAHNRFMTPEKEQVVREMTEQLLTDAPNATQPCLLLGKVQCGKTDTFLSIMGLCFDKGIDIAIVMTKGTNTLTTQTLKRLNKEFRFFKDQHLRDQKVVVNIWDVLDLGHRGGLSEYQLNDSRNKFIIVCKKEDKNMQYITELFENSELMRSKKVLVCDDEADFASRAYWKRQGKMDLAKISEMIEKLIHLPNYCRYMQITATPYSLYLQPDGSVKLRDDKEASSWLPRYTGLVPIHSAYVGGKQYFELSEDENSMFSCLNYEVSEDCNAILSARNEFYLENNVHSNKLDDFNFAIVTYLFSAAVRSIQTRKQSNAMYKSSCLIHCEIAQMKHQWQSDLIIKIIEELKKAIIMGNNTDLHVLDLERDAYEWLSESNKKGNAEGLINVAFPTFAEVEAEIKHILEYNDYTINVINSREPVSTMIVDDINDAQDGQLRLERTLNFFIGGSILDRGITIANMLCFFYGRDPKKFQMDTVLQHARMYGARSMEDMACTRLYTTEAIYDVLKTINNIDNMMYDYLKKHRSTVQTNDFISMVIGYDPRISASASNKYTPANTQVLKPHQRILPRGMQTGEPHEIADIVAQIDSIVKGCPGFNERTTENPFFELDYDNALLILSLIQQTFRYSEEWENLDVEWDPNDMATAMDHCLYNTDGKLYCLWRDNRDMGRERDQSKINRTRWIDAPDDGRNDTAPSREKATDRPVLILTRQNGTIEQGWRGAPFYWPVLVLPKQMAAGIYTLNNKKKFKIPRKQHRMDLSKYNPDEVLQLPISKQELYWLLLGAKKADERPLLTSNCALYLEKDFIGNYIPVDPNMEQHGYVDLSMYNNGVFPYEIKKYKNIYFRASLDYSGSQCIVELDSDEPMHMRPHQYTQDDTVFNTRNEETTVLDESRCSWSVLFNLKKVVEKKINEEDIDEFNEMKQSYENGEIEYLGL